MSDFIWLEKYPKNVDWNEEISSNPLYQIIDETVKNFPNKEAIDFLDYKLQYKELGLLVNQAAEGFKRIGVEKGTKVGLFLPNCPQFIISYFAILKAGGVVVNFSPLYSKPEIEHQIIDSEIEIIITLNLQLLYPKIDDLIGKCGKLSKVVVGKMEDFLPFPKSFLFPIFKRKEISKIPDVIKGNLDGYIFPWDLLFAYGEIKDVPSCNPDVDTAVIQYTGGTTGVSKGAELTHANVYINAMQSANWFGHIKKGEEAILGVLPLFHVFAMTTIMNFGISKGMKIILHPRFEIDKVLKDIQKKRPTTMPGVPTMFNAINQFADIDKYDLSSLNSCISGGAGLPVEVKKEFEAKTKCILIEGYGLTETSPVACANPVDGENKAGSIGLPVGKTIVKIEDIDNKGVYLPIGEKGELCIKGPQVMKGYWNQPEETDMVTTDDGFFRTGDIARMDEDGYVYIVDRLKEMIISGGFKIYPRNVEEVIYTHPHVLEAAVIGIPDEYKGQAVKAFIALKPDVEIHEKDIHFFLKDKLGKHELPSEIEFLDELPKTMIGKISKKDL